MTDNKLRVGVYQAPNIPQSFRVYATNVLRHFPAHGLEAIPFHSGADLPRTADVLWDIRSGGGNPPLEFMLGGPPLVVTVHGFAPITLPAREYFDTLWERLLSARQARQKLEKWRQLKGAVAALITVSEFSKGEAARLTGVPAESIYVCHHGVDTSSFFPDPDVRREGYFLHVSNNEPRKNLTRILRAFQRLRKHSGASLLLKLPADQASRYEQIEGVHVLSEMLSVAQLANLYQRAMAFVFPSLYEGFGLPILEAMACGCPVITSNVSACSEVAGDAALTIDPRDEDAILRAMTAICLEKQARDRLVDAGLVRARSFSWFDSAAAHARVLHSAAGRG
jgi:glycosyltransferase involved in cell wall biosynthesis